MSDSLRCTRVIVDSPEEPRDEADNFATMRFSADVLHAARPSIREIFYKHYSTLRRRCESFDKRGVLVAACDADKVRASVTLAAKTTQPNAAIIGRHSRADLYLPGDEHLSLRHAALLVFPDDGRGDIRFRLMNLRSSRPLIDEKGIALETLEAETPVFIKCSRYLLIALPTGTDDPWLDDAEAAWDCLPERVYLREDLADPPVLPQPVQATSSQYYSPTSSMVITRQGAKRAQILQSDDDELIARTFICASDRQAEIGLGRRCLERGVLFGRYKRCDNLGLQVLNARNISRVHLLITTIANSPYAIDTASTNGMKFNDSRVRIHALRPGDKLYLGSHRTYLEWRAET